MPLAANPIHDLMINPPPESIIFEDDLVYAALASYPLSKGHTVVVWKKSVIDLGQMNAKDFSYLMFTVEQVRNVLLKHFGVKKVYLMYMDEVKQVHWHLIPRYTIMGMAILKVKPKKVLRFPLAPHLRRALKYHAPTNSPAMTTSA